MVKKLSKKTKQENKIIVIILLTILISAVSLIINLIDFLSILEEKQIYTKIIVSDNYGFDLNDTALIFGMVRPGGSSSRDLTLENKYDKEVEVEIYAKGKIKQFISISDNKFALEKNKQRKISFTVSVPQETEHGNYTGFIIIKLKNKKII